jgi:hypothetical protein
MKPKEIVKNRIGHLRRKLEKAYENRSFSRCIELEGAIFYLEMVYMEIIKASNSRYRNVNMKKNRDERIEELEQALRLTYNYFRFKNYEKDVVIAAVKNAIKNT